MKKVYDIACFTNDWENDEATDLMFYLQEKMSDIFTNKKEALDWFNGRFNFLKNDWCKKWLNEFHKKHPNITIGVELYLCKVPNDFDMCIDNAMDYDDSVVKTLYFLEGNC